MKRPAFRPGNNIAMKVPTHQYEDTVAFYRDVLRFPTLAGYEPAIVFDYGGKNLWIDSVDTLSQAEIWLEVVTDDVDAAAEVLVQSGIARRDEIESLPDDLSAFWISSPASIIHLVSHEADG